MQDTNVKMIPEFIDIVFNNRNKEYGAYYLRKLYKKSMTIALIIGTTIILTAVGVPLIASYYNRAKGKIVEKDVTMEMTEMKTVKEDAPPPPPPPPPPAAIETQVKFTAPVVVDSVDEKVDLATSDDLVKNTNTASLDTAAVTVVKEEEKEVVIEKPKEVFVIVEEMPEFPGGEDALRRFIAENTKYPPVARENNIQGKVYVRFVVTYDGKVDQVSIVRKVDPILEEEAIRIVKSLPTWKPGKQRGAPVNVWYTVPITFQLQ